MQFEQHSRLRHLDFLRGLAILLVLGAHTHFSTILTNMGPVGVDLFFVLSGFLVSGLLFKEYITNGNVKAGRFLIRRGFKIYPVFWLALLFFWFTHFISGQQISYFRLAAEFFFLQNYVSGWGYAIEGVSWSLAIEEHFYIGLAIAIPFLLRRNILAKNNSGSGFTFEKGIFAIMIACLIMRILSTHYLPYRGRNYTMTHLRIDSLLSGVLVSYWYYFKKELLINYYRKYKRWILPVAFCLIAYSPFTDPVNSHFTRTVGFTLLFCGFSLILLLFILNKNINYHLDRLFSKLIVDAVSRIGYYSYSVYIVHRFVNDFFTGYFQNHALLNAIVSNTISITIGILVSKYVENYFLRLRDRYFTKNEIKITSVAIA